MDPELLQYYNRELQHVRDMGVEFAKEFPKVAGRIGIESLPCSDPYVERLLEGFAFMAARIQLKLDAQFPRFTQHLFELVYPHYLAPTPSMAVVQIQPDLANPSLADGEVLPRDSAMRSLIARGERTACEYRTAHELKLYPLEITEARYFATTSSLANINLDNLDNVRAGIRLQFKTTAGVAFDQLAMTELPIYLPGGGDMPKALYEQLLGNCVGVVIRPKGGAHAWQVRLPASAVRRHGFDEEQRLLPYGRRSFEGYRLLQEYFAFPERYLFVEFAELGEAVSRCGGTELEIIVLLDRSVGWLESALDTSQFALFCTPIINLFPKRADRVHVDPGTAEYHVLPDRTRPMDFEVHSVVGVKGYSGGAEPEQEFSPFYASRDPDVQREGSAFFALYRETRLMSSVQRRQGSRSSYIGNEVWVSLVDDREVPFSPNIRQLEFETWCTNRDLPLQITLGTGTTDFTLEVGAPVTSIRSVAGPTRPRPSAARGETGWRLLSHLTPNYLSITDSPGHEGAAVLQQLLSLYADSNDAAVHRQIEGIKNIASESIVRRIPDTGPITFGRGLEVAITCDESAFQGTGPFLLGSVLEEFFSKYVSLNSFTETVMKTVERGEVMRWPARIGRRHRL